MPSDAKRPLSRNQKSEIWKLFWLHAIGAAVFFPFVVVASNVGYIAELHVVPKAIILGIPNFLVWARFVTKIRKYNESTGIPYPSTFFALAIGSLIIVVGPLIMFLFLLIRMSRVPTLAELEQDKADEGMKPPDSHNQPSALKSLSPRQASAEQSKMEPFVVQKRQAEASEPPKPTIMKPEPEVKPSEDPIIDDEPFYEEVAKEIESDTMKTGLWTKAVTEADGNKERVKAIYIRLRVAQLMSAKEAELKELQRLENERIVAEERAILEAAIKEQAREEKARLEEMARLAAAELVKEKLEAEAEEARVEAARQSAILVEQERYENSPEQIRQKATEQFMSEFGNLASYPAKVSIGRAFIYFFDPYDLILGPDEILLSSRASYKKTTILVSPKLGDRIQEKNIIAFDVDARIEMADGTLLRLKLKTKTLDALRDWLYRKRRSLKG